MEDFLIKEFYDEMKEVNFDTYGLLDSNIKIHTLGTDSKLIGRIFEIYLQPIFDKIAKNHNFILKTPKSQTMYPDFTLMSDEKSKRKIAVDIKTSYIKNNQSPIKFALGSYGSFMQNNIKNIQYKYTDYIKHYVVGIIYKRNNESSQSKVINFENRKQVSFPFYDVKYFIQEKYKIAGETKGSGNTDNIGSISSNNLNDFISGNGPFSKLGNDIYELYWRYYPRYRFATKTYNSINSFMKWLSKHKDEVSLLHDSNDEIIIEALDKYINKNK